MREFDYIKNYILPLDSSNFIGDDGAILHLSSQFVITKDVLVEGVHFLENSCAELLAKKALRVNLSDIAAMGAIPYGYFLGLVLPKDVSDNWWKKFSDGLRNDNKLFNVKLLGGDTNANIDKRIIISVTAIGVKGDYELLRRSGAKVGDLICVSGTIGDAALGLVAYNNKSVEFDSYFKERYDLPNPRVNLGQKIARISSACIDISDGLVQDMNHICAKSNVGAEIYLKDIPLSDEASMILKSNSQYINLVLGGGDDYELLFTINPDKFIELKKIAKAVGVRVTKIGRIIRGDRAVVYDNNGKEYKVDQKGFNHFI